MLFLSIGTAACVATTDFVQLIIIFAVIGFASGTSGMAISTMIAESSPPGTRGMAMGGQSAARYGGRAVSPLMVGAILPASGYFASFAIAAVVCGTGLLSFLALLKKRR